MTQQCMSITIQDVCTFFSLYESNTVTEDVIFYKSVKQLYEKIECFNNSINRKR